MAADMHAQCEKRTEHCASSNCPTHSWRNSAANWAVHHCSGMLPLTLVFRKCLRMRNAMF